MTKDSQMPWIQTIDRISLLPILHGRMEFCRPVRQAIRDHSPDLVAVELPKGLESIYLQAVARLPRLSFITAQDLEDPEGGAALWRIEPTDPFCEAVRTAVELEIPIHFVDSLEPDYPLGLDLVPDPYSVTAIGPGAYYHNCRKLWAASTNDPRQSFDQAREHLIALRLSRLAEKSRVMFVGGMKHIDALLELLAGPLEGADPGTGALPKLSIFHPTLRTVRTLSEEMPFVMTLHELSRGGPGPDETWSSPEAASETPAEPEAKSEPSLDRKSVFGALEQLLGMKVNDEVADISSDQLKRIHAYLASLNPQTWTPPSFEDDEPPSSGAPEPEVEGVGRFFTYKDVNHRRAELLAEYQRLNGECRQADGRLDRQLVYRGLIELAAKFYEENTGETFKRWQHENFNTFARRYAHLQGRLLPGMLSMIFAARACVDHNYAFEFWDLATFYPWQDLDPENASMFDFDGENLEINGVRLRHFQLQRTFPRLRQTIKQLPVNERHTPTDDPNDWSGAFEDGRICSYPPEDIVIEDYGRYLQKKAIKVQSEAHSRTEPFTTSLLDGIDMRTTLRNWADGQRLYVREEKKISGGTGSVVLIFDTDKGSNKYPWCITWHGEYDQESDMAFYGTDRRKKIIGPGIARCEYGGLMLSYPPRRLANVWNDPHYAGAQTKAEVLLFAAIDYCVDRHILYVAAEAPRSYFFSLAQRLGKKLIYLPIGSLSPTSLERVRVFHVLAGHRFREIAKNYIW